MKVDVDGQTWRVWFIHRPELQHGHGDQNATTIAFVGLGEDSPTPGWATCSIHDVYSRSRGRKVALARALLAAGFDKAQRRQVWQGLFAQGMKL